FSVPAPKSVPVHPIKGGVQHLRVDEPAGQQAGSYHPTATSGPAAVSAWVSLAGRSPLTGASLPRTSPSADVEAGTTGGRAGILPVWISGRTANADVTVSMASHGAAQAAGVNGVVLGVSGRSAGTVSVKLDYSGFADA